jgi:hypothetical protein
VKADIWTAFVDDLVHLHIGDAHPNSNQVAFVPSFRNGRARGVGWHVELSKRTAIGRV